MSRTPGQELSDIFYGLQITTKIIDAVVCEYKDGKRTQKDFEDRVQSQVRLLLNNLKQVKPTTEKFVQECYDLLNGSTVSNNTEEQVQSETSENVVAHS
jgi:hypothetical protein